MPLSRVINLPIDPQVVTVLDTICIKSFQACFHCSRSTECFHIMGPTQILGISAADLRDKMINAGITDPRVYPVDIDKMEGRTLAVRIKWQFKWKNASVNQVHEGYCLFFNTTINFDFHDAQLSFINIEVSNYMQEITTSLSMEKSEDVVIPTMSLSDEVDPDQVSMLTPSK
ncbi:hypothetical protein QL285_021512 [Trifolium repens]|nr:hypothetical protein QL285_021512 [Trifolium repens]